MRSFIIYMSVGTLAVLVMNVLAPQAGFGLDAGARSALEPGAAIQSVDRTRKSDRLTVPKMAGKRPVPKKPAAVMLVGCEPAFSPLSPAARANFPGRCVT
jgi:hypothetical protein